MCTVGRRSVLQCPVWPLSVVMIDAFIKNQPWPGVGLRLTPALRRCSGARGQISLLPVHPRSESHSQMEGFQREDRHNPLPHIAVSITALKSAYRSKRKLRRT